METVSLRVEPIQSTPAMFTHAWQSLLKQQACKKIDHVAGVLGENHLHMCPYTFFSDRARPTEHGSCVSIFYPGSNHKKLFFAPLTLAE